MHHDDDGNGEWLAHHGWEKVSGGPPSPTPLSSNDPSMRVVFSPIYPKGASRRTRHQTRCASPLMGFVDIAVFGTAGQRHGTPLGHRHGQAWNLSRQLLSQQAEVARRCHANAGGSLEPGGLAANLSPAPRMGKLRIHVDFVSKATRWEGQLGETAKRCHASII